MVREPFKQMRGLLLVGLSSVTLVPGSSHSHPPVYEDVKLRGHEMFSCQHVKPFLGVCN